MLRNYLAAALRNLARNKLYAGINILGLSVGFAAAIVIALYVRHEYSYDRWIAGHERVFHVSQIMTWTGTPTMTVDATRPALRANLETTSPAFEAVARIQPDDQRVRRGDVEAEERIYWSDPDFLKVIPLPVIAGDPDGALATADSIVVTREIAMKYFGRPDPIGETLAIGDERHPMRVTAVLETLPTNTHLEVQMLASGQAAFSSLARDDRDGSNSDSLYTYFRLRPEATLKEVVAKVPELARLEMAQRFSSIDAPFSIPENTASWSLEFTPLAGIHLRPTGIAAMSRSADTAVLDAIAAVGILIIIIAGMNFANLSTARALRRSTEVGVRKAAGARRHDLVAQFLGESLLYAVIAMAIAIAIVELSLPYFAAFTSATLDFDYWRDPRLAGGIIAAVLVVGVLAGLYPACVLSAFRAAAVLKASMASYRDSGIVKMTLIVLQFAILIAIAVATLTIHGQTQFALNEGLRVDKDQVLLVQGLCNDTVREEVSGLPGVQAAVCMGATMLGTSRMSSTILSPDGTLITTRQSHVDFGLFEMYGLKPLAGRFFARDYGGDTLAEPASPNRPSIVLNESAVRRLGFSSPADAIGKTVSWSRILPGRGGRSTEPLPSTVIGVVRDFSFNSVREEIEPQIYHVDPGRFAVLSAKLDGRRVPEVLTAIDALWRRMGETPPTRVFLDEFMQRRYRDVEQQGATFGIFTGLALFIACIGLFGMATFNAERRTKEIGIRKAVGAGTGAILRLFCWDFAKPVLWANLIAWPVAYFLMDRWLSGFAYHIDLEPWVFLAAGAAALVIALATVSVQSFLAARAKPVKALRYE